MAQMINVRRARCSVCGGLFQVRVTQFRDEMCAIHKTPEYRSRITCPGSYDTPEEFVEVETPEYMASIDDKRRADS